MKKLIESKMKEYLIESGSVLNKLPSGTEISDVNGMRFSSWGGKLALVVTSGYSSHHYGNNPYFDPENMTRRYDVRYAVDIKSKKPMDAPDWAIGVEPYILDRRANYEKTTFKMQKGGGSAYGQPVINGGFGKSNTFWIKIKKKELYPSESQAIEYYYREKGYLDVSDFGVSEKEWKTLLKHSDYDSAFDSIPLAKANKLDNWLYRRDVFWKDIKGVYATTKKGDFKFVVSR